MNPDNPISSIMTTKMVTVKPNTPINEIKAVFDKNAFHHIPVIGDGYRLLGIISKEDFLKFAYLLSLNTTGKTFSQNEYANLTADKLMTHCPMQLDPDDTIGLAADIFLANKFHALPIVEDEQLRGIVTTHDLLQFSFNSTTIEKESEDYP